MNHVSSNAYNSNPSEIKWNLGNLSEFSLNLTANKNPSTLHQALLPDENPGKCLHLIGYTGHLTSQSGKFVALSSRQSYASVQQVYLTIQKMSNLS